MYILLTRDNMSRYFDMYYDKDALKERMDKMANELGYKYIESIQMWQRADRVMTVVNDDGPVIYDKSVVDFTVED